MYNNNYFIGWGLIFWQKFVIVCYLRKFNKLGELATEFCGLHTQSSTNKKVVCMTQSNKKSTPSIDELISNDLSKQKDDVINLDDFSLDNLNLDNLDSLLEKTPDTPTKAKADTKSISLDLDFGADEKMPEPKAKTSPTPESKPEPKTDKQPELKAEKTPDPKPTSKPVKDGSDILDELDALSQAQAKAVRASTLSEPSLPSLSSSPDDLNISKNPLLDELDDKETKTDDFELDSKDKDKADNSSAVVPVPKPAKKSLFGNKKDKGNKSKRAARTPTGKGDSKDTKRLMTIIIGAVAVLVLLIGAWFVLGGQGEEVAPTPEVASETTPAETPDTPALDTTSQAPSEGLPTPEGVPADGMVSVEGGTEAAPPADGSFDTSALDAAAAGVAQGTTPAPVTAPVAPPADTGTNVEIIDVDAITKADIPDDIALVKEEIDLLKDKGEQFSDQAKDLNKILGEMEQLTKQKEEQIALLERQIALLEEEQKKQQ